MNDSVDPAQELADKFKKHGFLDKIKHDILNKETSTETTDDKMTKISLEEALKIAVTERVREMVSSDEDLIFKNRGTTSALIEAQLLKSDYQKLTEGDNGIQLAQIIKDSLDDPSLIESIKTNLEALAKTEGEK